MSWLALGRLSSDLVRAAENDLGPTRPGPRSVSYSPSTATLECPASLDLLLALPALHRSELTKRVHQPR
jgi:hypothetical protein